MKTRSYFLLFILVSFFISCTDGDEASLPEEETPEKGSYIYNSTSVYYDKILGDSVHTQDFRGYIIYKSSNREFEIHPEEINTWSLYLADSVHSNGTVYWTIREDQNVYVGEDEFFVDGLEVAEIDGVTYHAYIKGNTLYFKYRSYTFDKDTPIQYTETRVTGEKF
ncbi:hypothetical protein [Flammeovirga sp. SubArs3]|uniref:hypothetical protein n=1 Tax=Flammeovirga sp. SubArs3 TaxID=2995316 RepID=UPI00248D1363|nr:hypothetical protein [Flammeovirga sp. SubArs3]